MTGRPFWLGLIIAIMLAGCQPEASPPLIADPAATPAVANAWQDFMRDGVGERPFVDFSAAGAHYSEKDFLPVIDTEFLVDDFGARPDDQIDDTAAIQKTIEAAQEAGGGIVTFAPGVYRLNEDPTFGGLRISASNMVLRGSDHGQTRLLMTKAMPPAVPGKKWTGPAMIAFGPLGGNEVNSDTISLGGAAAVIEDSGQGSRKLVIDDAAGFASGGYITLFAQGKQFVGSALAGKPSRALWTRVNDQGVQLREHHEIAHIDGNVLHLRQPLLVDVDASLQWYVRALPVIEHVGFDKICVEGDFTEPFEHHKNARHDSGFRALELRQTAHSWVSDSCFENVTTPVSVRGGVANTVMLNRVSGNSGHFGLQAEFATRTLFGLNLDTTEVGQFHGPSISHMSAGSVIWRYESPHGRGFDLHGTFPRQTLLDRVTLAGFGAWGGNVRDLPNHLGGLVLWNFTQTGDRVGAHFEGVLDFWALPDDPDQAYGFLTAVDPVIVGYRGPIEEVAMESVERLESLDAMVSPASLFEAQLEARLGKRPDWMAQALDDWERMIAQRTTDQELAP